MKSLTSFKNRVSALTLTSDKCEEKVRFAKAFDQVICENFPPSYNGSSEGDMMSQEHDVGKRNMAGGVEKPKITTWDAGWNVSNAIQGMFVLGLPYALLHGGYVGLFLIIVTAIICYYTGNILIECLYENLDGAKKRVRFSYADVAISCWGKNLGGHAVNAAQLIELLMTCVLYVVVSGNLMKSSFPHGPISEAGWSVIASLFLFPCIFLRHLRAVSRFSMACSVAQLVVLGVTIIYCFVKIENWAWESLNFSVDPKEFPISVGVIVFSYTSQIFLPSLEGSMEDRGKFKGMLCWSYVASCVTKAVFALVCFLTWSDRTKDVVTDNLPPGLRGAMNVTLVVKALLSYPLPYYQSLELIEEIFFTDVNGGWGSFLGGKRRNYNALSGEAPAIRTDVLAAETKSPESDETERSPSTKSIVLSLDDSKEQECWGCPSCYAASGDFQKWALVLRAGLVLCTLLMGVFIPHFALLMGLTGSLTGTSLAFLLPCAFHLQLKWNELKWRHVTLDVIIFLAGAVCALTGIYYSVIGLYDAYHLTPVGLNSSVMSNNSKTGPAWFPDFPEAHDDVIFTPIEPPLSDNAHTEQSAIFRNSNYDVTFVFNDSDGIMGNVDVTDIAGIQAKVVDKRTD